MYSLKVMRAQVCVSSSVVVCRVPFIATRCLNSWSKHGSTGRIGPGMGLEWALEGLGNGLQNQVGGLVQGLQWY